MSSPFPEDSTVEKINEEFQNFHEEKNEPPPSIKESSMDKIKKLSNDLGVDQIREDVDAVKQSIQLLHESQQGIIDSMNQLVTSINNGGGGVSQPQSQPSNGNTGMSNMSPENLQMLVGMIDGLVDTYKKIKGNDAAPQPVQLISQDTINQKMQQSFMDDLQTGESIRKFITDALKKKATQQVVKQSMQSIGSEEPIHGPE